MTPWRELPSACDANEELGQVMRFPRKSRISLRIDHVVAPSRCLSASTGDYKQSKFLANE